MTNVGDKLTDEMVCEADVVGGDNIDYEEFFGIMMAK